MLVIHSCHYYSKSRCVSRLALLSVFVYRLHSDLLWRKLRIFAAMAPRRPLRPEAPMPPEHLREQCKLTIDLDKYPFGQLMRKILEEPAECDLSKLHETPHAQDLIKTFQNNPKNVAAIGPRGNVWNKRYRACPQRDPELQAAFRDCYHRYLREFVLEHLGTKRVAFQSEPTFRCHLPHTGAPGRAHRDEDYKHARGEINFWIPLTQVYDTNSLYVESKRDVEDFKAFEAAPGELLRFYANQVWHYTVPNETPHTRVSFDFRVVREEEWSVETFCEFKLGGYYGVMTLDGPLTSNSEDMRSLQERYGCFPTPRPKKAKMNGAEGDSKEQSAEEEAPVPTAGLPDGS
eukprot:TRINITY_DN2389_c0_g1_i3.p1 TRINITY_DN2389_c0_g1~~TRINITY_DN2389_c0_g1_i3.p1  ORF type:complete len:346 (+),score=58.99 TRINITY_DN2389_c0_g1_i3:59-1096(+)